ncbi:hypothetical protein [Paenimyroides aestuarii]|uniref:Uncharacterized protein n=1 Tax=Paenimyroides aestuarii TaxID=2968490 RepID=A0ABY5NTH2_9FLAO|nr:hypothetical protein [Paenimyroides aestuarii]UUV21880.1 hypothetical protein NPX36_02170 [Paenimyroides aestuarii]
MKNTIVLKVLKATGVAQKSSMPANSAANHLAMAGNGCLAAGWKS